MEFLEMIKAVILGVIQGITEWLPISSTGHMILADEFIKMNFSQDFVEMFMVVIQFGSILAVVVLFFNKLNPFTLKKIPVKNKNNMADYRSIGPVGIKMNTISLWSKVVVAVVPAGIIGLLFDDKINSMFYNSITVATTLILYGILFIVLEHRKKKSTIDRFAQLTYKTALMIGAFQILALIPGTSRSGATILGAVFLGTSRYVAAEFSFFLAIPMMFGASVLKLVKFGFDFTGTELAVLLTGMIVAFVVSIFAIKFLLGYIKKHDFKAFGYYRIVLGIIVLLYFAFK